MIPVVVSSLILKQRFALKLLEHVIAQGKIFLNSSAVLLLLFFLTATNVCSSKAFDIQCQQQDAQKLLKFLKQTFQQNSKLVFNHLHH